MVHLPSEIRPVREGLLKVGFDKDRLRLDVPVPGSDFSVSLLAFSDQPFDSRTASISALQNPNCDLRKLEKFVADYFKLAKVSGISNTNRKPSKSKVESGQMSLSIGSQDESFIKVQEGLKALHWRIDAEVLSLYNLPEPFERKILDLFTGIRRRGVPFVQTEYFPKGFTDLYRLCDLLAITSDWEKTNRRRAKLMDSEENGTLADEECSELRHLQTLADASVTLFKSLEAANPAFEAVLK
jgi:hypothetical protein